MTCNKCDGTGMAYRREDKDPYEGYKLADKKPCLSCCGSGVKEESAEVKKVVVTSGSVNYNDGKWHGWNGGERPVHPYSVVDLTVWSDRPDSVSGLSGHRNVKAGSISWNCVNSFRVIKEFKEPAEMMIGKGSDGSLVAFVVGEWSDLSAYKAKGFIHVREVLE